MSKDKDTNKLPETQEILRGRAFSLAEALTRQAGGALKGASPISAHDQAVFALRSYLENHLVDPEGSLRDTLIARVADNQPLVAKHRGNIRKILATLLDQALANDDALAELVRETDTRWGRMYSERPYFEHEDQPADPNDPYTLVTVRHFLTRLQRTLNE